MPDLKAATFSGFEAIDVNIKEPTNAITLNAIELTFQNVGIDFHAGVAEKGSVSLDPEKQQATFTSPRPSPRAMPLCRIPLHGYPQQRAARLLSF